MAAAVACPISAAWAEPTPRTPSTARRLTESCAQALGLRSKGPRDEPVRPFCAEIRRLSSRALTKLGDADDLSHTLESPQKRRKDSVRSSSGDENASTHSGESSSPSLPGSIVSSDEDVAPRNEVSVCIAATAQSRSSSCSAREPREPVTEVKGVTSRYGISEATEFKRMARMIGEKAEFKYRTVRDAFVAVDANGDGKLDVHEITAFFKHFGLAEDVALHFFKLMDRDGSGDIDWKEFMAVFAPVFRPSETFSHPPAYRTWRLCPSVEGQKWYFS